MRHERNYDVWNKKSCRVRRKRAPSGKKGEGTDRARMRTGTLGTDRLLELAPSCDKQQHPYSAIQAHYRPNALTVHRLLRPPVSKCTHLRTCGRPKRKRRALRSMSHCPTVPHDLQRALPQMELFITSSLPSSSCPARGTVFSRRRKGLASSDRR